MNQARADFNKIDKVSVNPVRYAANPSRFSQLTSLYVRFGSYEDAIAVHEESIKSFNRLARSLPPEYKEKNIVSPFTTYSRFTDSYPPGDSDFINRYFDRIYENVGKIENSRIRLSQRFGLLEKNFEKVLAPDSIPGIPNIIIK